MIILRDGTQIVLFWVISVEPCIGGDLRVRMVDGSSYILTEKEDKEAFTTALRNQFKDKAIVDLSK